MNPVTNARFIRDNRREACIIAPFPVNPNLEDRLEKAFGGYTVTLGRGVWQGMSEDVAVYTIAMLDTAFNRDKLLTLAEQYRVEAVQQVVYVRLPAGNVIMVGED